MPGGALRYCPKIIEGAGMVNKKVYRYFMAFSIFYLIPAVYMLHKSGKYQRENIRMKPSGLVKHRAEVR